MTTSPTPLQERIERILAEHPILPPTYAGDDPIARKRERTAARITEEVAAEVRKAQADALRDAADEDFYDGDMDMPVRGYAELYYRAERYEQED